jgi:hypothetical protein
MKIQGKKIPLEHRDSILDERGTLSIKKDSVDKTLEENTIIWHDSKAEEMLRLSKDGFFYKGEKVDDINDVYTRFTEWMNNVETDKTIKAIITEYKSLREELEDLKEHNLDENWELCYESQINSIKQKIINLEKKLKQ